MTVKNYRNPTGLSEAGRRWLQEDETLPISDLGEIAPLFNSVSRTFGITTCETMVAVCSALSAMVAHSVVVREPWGAIVPCSLQLLIMSGDRINVFGAVECLGESVSEVLAQMMGRRRGELPGNFEESIQKLLALRRQQIFPVGELLTIDMAKRFIEEDGDCVFGSLSYELALAEFQRSPLKEAAVLDQFMRAGWRGSTVPGVEGHPVHPTVSLAWGASRCRIVEAVQEGILERLPGLLIARSRFPESQATGMGAPWPITMQEKWKRLLMKMFGIRVKSAPRHVDPDSPLELSFGAEAAEEVAALRSFEGRYSLGYGVSSKLLLQAPLQVSKIAGLLAIAQSMSEISLRTVRLAKEIYRLLCRDTLSVVESAIESSSDSYVNKRKRILEKFRLLGPLSLKDLASTYPKLAFEDLSTVVLSLLDDGVIESVDGVLRSVPVTPAELALVEPRNMGAIAL